MKGLAATTARLRWAVGASLRSGTLVVRKAARRITPGGSLRLERFLFAPPDLRTADPTMAAEIYSGLFVFVGRVVDTRGLSPFDVEAPSRAWADALHGFGWLRHLQAAGTALARDNARSLIADFVARGRPYRAEAHAPTVIARRVMSFLAQSPFVLTDADHDFYTLYLEAVRQDATRLRDALHLSDDPGARLTGLIALTLIGLSVEGAERLERRFGPQLERELGEQIDADGGHVSRNARILIELMLDMLPLKATYAARGVDPPAGLIGAMDRIVPHLRMLRHPDGTMALFNGMGVAQIDALATIFASHDVAGRTLSDAPHAGYARLEAGDTTVLVETGPSPPFAASAEAMAGCGSFELSSGRQKLIVNCGLPRRAAADMPVELRGSAAHSVATLDDQSSCVFLSRDGMTRIIEGPRQVTLERAIGADDVRLSLSHDGYLRRHGLMTARTLTLRADGAALEGVERFSSAGPDAVTPPPPLARFHLHPTVRAGMTADGTALIAPPNGPSWLLMAEGGALSVEESMYFAGIDGARRSSQIVLRFAEGVTEASWVLARRDG